jgi:peptidoglycan/xylan/chitin deacetylase (PgdA/CDA1 family)
VTDTLEIVRLSPERLPQAARWADGLDVRLPSALARHIATERNGLSDPAFSAEAAAAADHLRMRAAFLVHPPLSGRLPIHYHRIPVPVRKLVAAALGRWQRLKTASWARFPGWPVDLSADFVADLAGAPGITFQGQTPLLLTHDIDSPEGLSNLVEMFLPIEEAAGVRSANYIVPCAWPPDPALLDDVLARGHEIGIHGYDHANRTPFAETHERRQRIADGRAFGNRYGAIGYRAPSLVRTAALLEDLAPHYRYDSSIPTSGGPFPVPNNGCASARPWKLGSLWEIPLSMPRDGSLRFLGHSPREIGRMWREAADLIANSGGVVVLLNHCEERFSGNPAMLDAYRGFIAWAQESGRFAFMRPADLIPRLENGHDARQSLH